MDKSTRLGIGIVANVLSILSSFFWIPLLPLLEFRSTGSLGDHSPATHLAALLSHLVWIVYGCVHPNSILLITSNVVCSFIVICHLLFFTIRSKSWNNVWREVFALVILEIIFVGIVTTTVLTLVPDTKLRSHIIGMIAMICQLGTYVSQILLMKLTITTRDSDELNMAFAALSSGSGVYWMAYAMDPLDLYLLVPNAACLVLGTVQCFLEAALFNSDVRGRKAANLKLSQSASSPSPNGGGCDVEAH